MEIFRNNDGVRYDWKWFSFGWHKLVFWGNTPYSGITFHFHMNRAAPIHFHLINRFGWWKYADRTPPSSLYFTGSRKEPYHGWYFHVGRAFVGGETPKWMLRLHKWLRLKRWEWQARRDGEGLCPECRKGVILGMDGYPGETIYQCSKCHHVEGSDFDINAVI